ncbi:PP2C family protein-serine/threonine phosphatase [Streptomyces sp. NPDC090306]|uniref:PP2C family protein-serine/threonine phosphatase n=1 Tax=Streptomyces sp. NPDC090306 TaxID=3365961 RepID=UPI003814AAF0
MRPGGVEGEQPYDPGRGQDGPAEGAAGRGGSYPYGPQGPVGPHARAGGRLPGDAVPDPGLGTTAPAPAGTRGHFRADEESRRRLTARALVRMLPALLIVGGACYDYLTPTNFTAVPFFTAAPLIAAAILSRRGTVLVGVAGLLVVALFRAELDTVDRVDAITEVITVVTVSVLAVVINLVVRRSDERLASAREIAEAAQRAVLPQPAHRIGGLDIAALYEAAQADAFIGGDLYAVQDSPYGVRLVVGDVRGKGMSAVAAVAVVIGSFREAAEQEATLQAVAQRLERALAREGTRRNGLDAFEGFTTAVLAEIPHGLDVVRLVSRGHPPPLLLDADGAVTTLLVREPSLPLGMGDLGMWPDRVEESDFPSGATLLFYTDGLSEARDARGRFFDPARRLSGRSFDDADQLVATVAAEVRRYSGGGTADDMALLAVRRP